MGAAAAIPAFAELTDEQKAEFKTKFDALVAEGKTEEEAIKLLSPPEGTGKSCCSAFPEGYKVCDVM
jgi:hypothetical protein